MMSYWNNATNDGVNMHLVLLGRPGAGKGTIAEQLQEDHGFCVLTPGALYRKEAAEKTAFGLKAQSYWGDGNLCPDEMTNELIKNTLLKLKPEKVIFDGYPRTIGQAGFLDFLIKIHLVLDLNISDDVSVARLLKRREKENRPDDTEEIIRQRIKVYHSNNDAIVKYYSSDLGRYKIIDCDRPKEDVFQDAKKIIADRYMEINK